MNQRFVLRPDTQAWISQSWGFFALACSAELATIWWLPLTLQIKLLLTVILAATVYIAFSLAKTIRDNRDGRKDTDAWIAMTYGMAAAMICAMAYGVFFVSPDWKERLMLGIGLGWVIQSTLVLAKTIRDKYEADQDQATIAQETLVQKRQSHESGSEGATVAF